MEATGEKWSAFYLFQSISVAIQRANASCMIGTVPQLMKFLTLCLFHEGKKPFKCEICNSTFKEKKSHDNFRIMIKSIGYHHL